jgi:DNA-binding TFAR19-related protein (PDSD5 family)
MEAIREAHRAAIAEILTDEQLAQLEELRVNRPNRNDSEEEEEITLAAKPVGAAIESSSWASIKSQVR